MPYHLNSSNVATVFVYFLLQVCGKDWQYIDVRLKSLQPNGIVYLSEGSLLTIYCGSVSPVTWSFLSFTENYWGPIVNRHLKKYRSIQLNNLKLNDSGHYNCHGMNGSARFVVNVQVQVLFNRSYGLSGLVIPSWVEVPENGSVTLQCDSEGPVEWKTSHFHQVRRKIEGKTLTLYNLQTKHSGRYMCRGRMRYPFKVRNPKRNRVFHSSAVVIVDGTVRYTGLNQGHN